MSVRKKDKRLPFIVGRVDGQILSTGKKRRRFKTELAAGKFLGELPRAPKYYMDSPVYYITYQWKLPEKIVSDGVYINKASSTRPDMTHTVYSGDTVNSPHCTCEDGRYGEREKDVLFTCKHIDEVVYGIGKEAT